MTGYLEGCIQDRVIFLSSSCSSIRNSNISGDKGIRGTQEKQLPEGSKGFKESIHARTYREFVRSFAVTCPFLFIFFFSLFIFPRLFLFFLFFFLFSHPCVAPLMASRLSVSQGGSFHGLQRENRQGVIQNYSSNFSLLFIIVLFSFIFMYICICIYTQIWFMAFRLSRVPGIDVKRSFSSMKNDRWNAMCVCEQHTVQAQKCGPCERRVDQRS